MWTDSSMRLVLIDQYFTHKSYRLNDLMHVEIAEMKIAKAAVFVHKVQMQILNEVVQTKWKIHLSFTRFNSACLHDDATLASVSCCWHGNAITVMATPSHCHGNITVQLVIGLLSREKQEIHVTLCTARANHFASDNPNNFTLKCKAEKRSY